MGKQVKGMRAFSTYERREIRATLIEKYGAICQICIAQGKSVRVAAIDLQTLREDRSLSIDHIVPLADGGLNVVDNMWPTHIACNERKGSARQPGRVRTNRSPRNENVTQVTGSRLAYRSGS